MTSNDIKELVERLRDYADAGSEIAGRCEDERHAAQALTTLQAENAELREREQELETRFWSIVDPNSVPSDMWDALDRLARAYRKREDVLDKVERHLSAVQYDPAPYTAMKHRLARIRNADA